MLPTTRMPLLTSRRHPLLQAMEQQVVARRQLQHSLFGGGQGWLM